MEISQKKINGSAVLELNGDLDYNTYKEFNNIVTQLIEGLETEKIVLAMNELKHIDSMGLGTITNLWKIADQNAVDLVLAAVPKNIQNMIKLVNLDKRIKVFKNIDEAMG